MNIDLDLASVASRIRGPYVIGATGGSGTRVIARIVRHAGLFIGTNLNVSEDALDFGDYSDRWINAYVTGCGLPSWPSTEAEMILDLEAVLERHLSTLAADARAWGWKEPRSIYLLPFFHAQFPGLKFLHVVRDGRDMAYSANQNQLRKHGATLLDRSELERAEPLQSIALWSRINLLAADYGAQRLPGRYMLVRFEDLCSRPVPTVHRVFEFFDLEGDAERIARLEVHPPESLGWWRNQEGTSLAELHRVGEAALKRFGYWTPA